MIADIETEDIFSKIEEDSGSENLVEKETNWYSKLQKTSQRTRTMEEEENSGILGMRNKWSNWVLFFIGAIIFFDMFLIYKYGTNQWKFTDPTVVIVVITDNFLKIFGLGILITREIFKKIYNK